MPKVPHDKLESKDGGCSSMEYRSEQSLRHMKQPKFPPLPFRMLDEESWLSGSELKTDNSTSEDEEVRRSFVGGKFERRHSDEEELIIRNSRNLGTKTKLRSKNKKKISSIRKVMTFSSNSSSATSAARCSTESYHQRVSTTQCTGDEVGDSVIYCVQF